MKKQPDCECGHSEEDHNYDPRLGRASQEPGKGACDIYGCSCYWYRPDEKQ